MMQASGSDENGCDSSPETAVAQRWQLQLMHVWLCLPAALTLIYVWTQAQFEVDLWPHLNLGRSIWESGELPSSAFYSYRSRGEGVIDQNWLGQTILYLLHAAGGREATRCGVALMYAAGVSMLTWSCYRRSHSVWATMVSLITCLLLCSSNFSARTQVFSFTCFATAATLLLHWPRKAIWPYVVCVVMQVFWSNTHGAFPLGVILPGIFLAAHGLDRWKAHGLIAGIRRTLTDAECRPLLILCPLMLAACFVNPTPEHTPGYLSGVIGRSQQRGITEWQRTTAGDITGGLFYLSALLTVICVGISRRRITWRDALLLLVFFLLGTRASRMVIWWGYVAALVMTPLLAAGFRRLPNIGWSFPIPIPMFPIPARVRHWWRLLTQDTSQTESSWLNTAIAGLLMTIICVSTPWTRQFNPLLSEERRQTIAADEPFHAVRHLVEQNYTGRLFSHMEWGAYATFALPASSKIHMDAMIDFFPDDVWSDYCTVMQAAEGWDKILQRDHVDAFLLPAEDSPAVVQLLRTSHEWTETYRDDVALIFRRRSADHATKTRNTGDQQAARVPGHDLSRG